MEETLPRTEEARSSALAGSGLLRVVYEDDNQVAAIAGRIHVAVVRGALDAIDVSRGDALRAECAREVGRATAVLIVAREGTEIPRREEVLARAIETARAHGADVAAVAVVIGGAGFWASTARSAINTVVVVARESYPTRFFARTQDAVTFLLEALGDASPSVEALTAEIDSWLR